MSEQPNENDGMSNEDGDGRDKAISKYGRRALMLGAAAGMGAAASLVAGAESAEAANGGPVLLGEANSAKGTTSVTSTKGDGLSGITKADDYGGVLGEDHSPGGGFGLQGYSDAGNGLYAQSVGGSGIPGYKAGVIGDSNTNDGVVGQSSAENGVVGVTTANGQSGVYGEDASSDGGYGVYGSSTNGFGVYGTSSANPRSEGAGGVYGVDTSSEGTHGVSGVSTNGYGVFASSETSFALYALFGGAFINGDATVTGTLSKGGGSFKIDHPRDPAGKYLYHSFVESPDMMNVYNGTVTLDAQGRATVELPDWFEALNRDYRYQLTALDAPAPDLHISLRVTDGKFSIAGGKADQEVSWQVTGIRQDAWANANRIPVEVDKPAEDQGRYLHPELFGGEAITIMARARAFARRHEATRPVSREAAQP
jgi:hypothetical protein